MMRTVLSPTKTNPKGAFSYETAISFSECVTFTGADDSGDCWRNGDAGKDQSAATSTTNESNFSIYKHRHTASNRGLVGPVESDRNSLTLGRTY